MKALIIGSSSSARNVRKVIHQTQSARTVPLFRTSATRSIIIAKITSPIHRECATCVPPAVVLNRQIFRHVDYVSFMNKNELSKFVGFWQRGGMIE